jgi:2-oxoglutarate dehydrogenase E1 component
MTAKSLLRHPRVSSSLYELAEGGWQPVIDDALTRQHPEPVRRLLLCSGKVYVDLVSSPQRQQSPAIAVARMEQLCPFPSAALQLLLAEYPHLAEVVWVQEEPENMGAWAYVRPQLCTLLDGRWPLHYLGRPPSSSPAEGSASWYAINQQALVEQAYNLDGAGDTSGVVWLKRV